MKLHRTVLWSLRAENVRRSLTQCREFTPASFRGQWSAGPMSSMAVVMVRYGLTNLIEEIELWLRDRIEAELRRSHGNGWWAAIPKDVQQRAAYRHRLACAEFGSRRAAAAHSSDWLSFGDVLRVLDGLNRDSWVRCLDAMEYSQLRSSRALRKVKAFRDARIAHLQSGGPTTAEVAKVLDRIDKVCQLLRPSDYLLSMAARKVLLSQEVGQHRRLLFDLYESSSRRRPKRTARLRALGRVIPPSRDGVPRGLNLTYYDALLACCAEAGGTISQFVGEVLTRP